MQVHVKRTRSRSRANPRKLKSSLSLVDASLTELKFIEFLSLSLVPPPTTASRVRSLCFYLRSTSKRDSSLSRPAPPSSSSPSFALPSRFTRTEQDLPDHSFSLPFSLSISQSLSFCLSSCPSLLQRGISQLHSTRINCTVCVLGVRKTRDQNFHGVLTLRVSTSRSTRSGTSTLRCGRRE